MIDRQAVLDDLKRTTGTLVDDLRSRTEEVEEVRQYVRGLFSQAQTAGRTDHSYEEWREDLLAQVAVDWVLASVFVRFCEDNGLYATPLLSGPGDRQDLARDHRADWLAVHPEAGDREWLEEVFRRYQDVPATVDLFGERNPLWQFGPSADGARELLELWWAIDRDTAALHHDFTDPDLDTRFLGDLYQDLSDHAKKTYALLQTPEFIEEFILDYTLDSAIETFGLEEVRMIDPTCGSGHFLLGAFDRILSLWREEEPGTPIRELIQRSLDAVNGVDLNPYAVAIARFRLLVAALRVSGINQLVDAPAFRISVAVGDSLIHGRRSGRLFADAEGLDPVLRHRYPTEDEELANRLLESGQYTTVVGNPPYITVKDKAARDTYRALYETAHGHYSISVPFTERFFDLAGTTDDTEAAGYVGMITTNTFMKREFGKKLVERYLPTIDLTHVTDTSGAYIAGHGTPTVILFGRHQKPQAETVRAVLGIRGEPGQPADAAKGEVWTSIVKLVDHPGAENEYISVEDVPRHRFATHPWSLQGGAAPEVKDAIESGAVRSLKEEVAEIGFGAVTREDEAFRIGRGAALRHGVREHFVRPLVAGEEVRDWDYTALTGALWPYDEQSLEASTDDATRRFLWRYRRQLSNRIAYGKSQLERGLEWWEYSMFFANRFRTSFSIVFAFVATHNHFVLDHGGKVFKQSAPVIKLPEGAGENEHLGLVGLLNTSVACFWMKQVFHNKGSTIDHKGARQTTIPFENFWEFDGTKLQQFPLPKERPSQRAGELHEQARQLTRSLPDAVLEGTTPSRDMLGKAQQRVASFRSRLVAIQEELDWECYQLYGLLEEDLTLFSGEVPGLEKGERAFEIFLARQMAAGDGKRSWFERHGSTPITELPRHWPESYRRLVERRIELIQSDRAIGLLEQPEYKRRWNWEGWEDLQEEALRDWLLDRLEGEDVWREGNILTCARLADRMRTAEAFVEAASLYRGRLDVDLTELVTDLVEDESVPFAASWRYEGSGLRKRREWERVWDLQRAEDAIDARTKLPSDDPDRLDEEDAELQKKEQGLDRIPVPPKYRSSDFARSTYWRLRGKLDVPKERFILYPGTQVGADSSAVVGWAGWDHLQQARALAGHFTTRKDEGAEKEELAGLLAGLVELLPWLKQWHNDIDPAFGQRMGDFFASFTETEARGLGLTVGDLRDWTPE